MHTVLYLLHNNQGRSFRQTLCISVADPRLKTYIQFNLKYVSIQDRHLMLYLIYVDLC